MWRIVAVVLFIYSYTISSSDVPQWKKRMCDNLSHGEGFYTCSPSGEINCLPGWTGDQCNVPVCKEGCDPQHGYCRRPGECRCKIGWSGDLCDECMRMPGCRHGYCNNSFECRCEEGWDGLFCSQPMCMSGCHSTRGYCDVPGECRCRIGWAGKTCSTCQKLPGCRHGFCTQPLECRCEEGWTGLFCNIPICAKNCSSEHGYCERPGQCRCEIGWWKEDCNTCFPYPGCVHGGCDKPWDCNCKDGWGGMLCDIRLDFCDRNPVLCMHGGTCMSLLPEDGDYSCVCPPPFTGKNCDAVDHSVDMERPRISKKNQEKIADGNSNDINDNVQLLLPEEQEEVIDNSVSAKEENLVVEEAEEHLVSEESDDAPSNESSDNIIKSESQIHVVTTTERELTNDGTIVTAKVVDEGTVGRINDRQPQVLTHSKGGGVVRATIERVRPDRRAYITRVDMQ